MRYVCSALLIFSLAGVHRSPVQTRKDYLSGDTVLIVRHAEKPLIGKELTPAGEARARAYAHYFEPFQEEGFHFKVDALYAAPIRRAASVHA